MTQHFRPFEDAENYVADVGKTPLLTPQEMRKVCRRAQRGDRAACDLMVRANLRLVAAVAKRYVGRGVPLEDLIGYGCNGLIRAIRRWKPKVATFSTYAWPSIERRIQQGIDDGEHLIRIPRYHLVTQYMSELSRKEGETQRPVDLEEVANKFARVVAPRIVAQAIKAAKANASQVSIHRSVAGERPLEESLLSSKYTAEESERAADASGRNARIRDILSSMPPRLAAIITYRFGLVGPKLTLNELGERYDLSRERIRQLEVEALQILRRFCAQRGLTL